jgi:hypothetical protein
MNFHSLVTFSLSDSKFSFVCLFSDIMSLGSSPTVRDHISERTKQKVKLYLCCNDWNQFIPDRLIVHYAYSWKSSSSSSSSSFSFFLMPFLKRRIFSFYLWILQIFGGSPWAGDQSSTKASTYTGQHNTEKHRHISMPGAGFETAIPMFERPKTVLALDPAAIETGTFESHPHDFHCCTEILLVSVYMRAYALCLCHSIQFSLLVSCSYAQLSLFVRVDY